MSSHYRSQSLSGPGGLQSPQAFPSSFALILLLLLWAPAARPQVRGPERNAPRSTQGSMRGAISGSVLTDGNKPAGMVKVEVRAFTGRPLVTTYTDETGHFSADGSSEKGYVISAEAPGYDSAEQTVDTSTPASDIVLYLKKSTVGPTPLAGSGNVVSVQELMVPEKARRFYDKGLQRLAKQDAAGSLEEFKKATAAYPEYSQAYFQIGVVNMQLSRLDEAEQALQRAIDVSSGREAGPQFALAALFCQREQFADAERVARRGMERDAGSWKGPYLLGQALFGLNRVDEAERHVREAVLRKPDAAGAYALLADIHLRNSNYPAVLQDLDAYMKLQPDAPASERARHLRAEAERMMASPKPQSGRYEFLPPRFAY